LKRRLSEQLDSNPAIDVDLDRARTQTIADQDPTNQLK
jgi:hypothetical protein